MVRIPPLRLWLSPLCRFIAVGTFETQGQALLAVETVNAFMVIPPALPPEQDVNPPVTVMHAGFRDLADTQAQRTVIGRHRAATERTAADLQRKTDLPFAGFVTRLQLPEWFLKITGNQGGCIARSGLSCRRLTMCCAPCPQTSRSNPAS